MSTSAHSCRGIQNIPYACNINFKWAAEQNIRYISDAPKQTNQSVLKKRTPTMHILHFLRFIVFYDLFSLSRCDYIFSVYTLRGINPYLYWLYWSSRCASDAFDWFYKMNNLRCTFHQTRIFFSSQFDWIFIRAVVVSILHELLLLFFFLASLFSGNKMKCNDIKWSPLHE